MQNTSTTYSLCDTLAWDPAAFCDTVPEETVIVVPLKDLAPRIPLHKPERQTGSLIYTVAFLIVFAVIRLRGKNLFPLLTNVIANKKKYEMVLNEGITQNLVYYFLSLFLSFSVLSIAFTYLTRQDFDLHRILCILLYLIGWHLFFICVLRLCSWIFDFRGAREECVVNLWAYHIAGGLVIAPFVLAAFFVKPFAIPLIIKITAVCLILFCLFKFIRWIKILLAYNVPIFYMILYLCTLEVMPWLVLYKLLAQ